jgi:hypothetical protein
MSRYSVSITFTVVFRFDFAIRFFTLHLQPKLDLKNDKKMKAMSGKSRGKYTEDFCYRSCYENLKTVTEIHDPIFENCFIWWETITAGEIAVRDGKKTSNSHEKKIHSSGDERNSCVSFSSKYSTSKYINRITD